MIFLFVTIGQANNSPPTPPAGGCGEARENDDADKKRRLELLELFFSVMEDACYCSGQKVRLMRDPQFNDNHPALMTALKQVDNEWLERTEYWRNEKEQMTEEEIDFIRAILPRT